MIKEDIKKLSINFDSLVQKEENIEFWYARDLQKLLDYKEWRTFENVINKAKLACENSKSNILDHFVDAHKMVLVGSGVNRKTNDYKLTRYACYLIAQNGNSRKETIAFAQTYFAVQTRKQEILEERMAIMKRLEARKKLSKTEIELSRNIHQRGVGSRGFGRIRAKGDKALFGGKSTQDMKERLKVPKKRPLADFLSTLVIQAKDFATGITNFNIHKSDIRGETKITNEHVKNNEEVRDTLVRSGIKPEELPVNEDIKKIERKVNSSNKKLAKEKLK